MGIEKNSGVIIYVSFYLLVYFQYLIHKEKLDIYIYSVFMIYIFIVLDLALFPIPITQARISQLFDLKRELEIASQINLLTIQINKQFIYNILMLIPFGIFINILFYERYSFLKTVLFSFLFSLSIESIQFITVKFLGTFRVFDINDLLANTLGGIFGFIIVCIIKRCRNHSSIDKHNLV